MIKRAWLFLLLFLGGCNFFLGATPTSPTCVPVITWDSVAVRNVAGDTVAFNKIGEHDCQ